MSTDGSPTQGGDSFAASRRVGQVCEPPDSTFYRWPTIVGDYGERALRQTLDRFAGKIRPSAPAPMPSRLADLVILERGGVRIGFLATDSIGESPAATSSRPGTNRLDMPPRTGPLDRDDLRRTSRMPR